MARLDFDRVAAGWGFMFGRVLELVGADGWVVMEQTEIINGLVEIVDYLASIIERLAKQVPDDRDISIARDVAIRAGQLRNDVVYD